MISDRIYVSDEQGTPVTGLVQGDFSNMSAVADDDSTIPVTIAAVGGGVYAVSFDGDTSKTWFFNADYVPLNLHFSERYGPTSWGGAGNGNVVVDDNTYTELRLTSTDGNVGNFAIRFYLKADYDAGRTSESYVRARSVTLDNGHMAWGVNLNSGLTYTAVFTKQEYRTVTQEVTPHA